MQTHFDLAVLVAAFMLARPVEYTGTPRVTSHELVPINPDVKVVADADEPLFFARGSYWLFHDGSWYRAPQIGDRWIETAKPPVPVVQIDQPYSYTRYRRDHDTTA